MRRARRMVVALWVMLLSGALLTVGAAPASAHAYLESSSPTDGASLVAAPTSIELRFSEHVVPESTEVTVEDTHGRRVTPLRLAVVEHDEDRESPVTVVAALPPLPVGAYHVSWRTLSSDDLHESAGILAFGVQSTVSAVGPSESSPDPLELVGRWAVLAGIAAGLGAIGVGRLLRGLPRDSGRRLGELLRGWARLVLAVAATLALLVLLVDLVRFGATAFTPSYAVRSAARVAALVVAVLVIAPVVRNNRAPGVGVAGRDLVIGSALVAAVALTVSLGHVGTRGGPTWFVASTAHILGALAWSGCVAGLTLACAARGSVAMERTHLWYVLRRFRAPAVVAVVVVAVSGIYLASDVVVSLDAALLTTYGRVLLLKLGAAGVAGILAWLTTRALHRRQPDGRGLRRRPVVGAEAVALLVVVALGGLLASGQPAVSALYVATEQPSVIDDRPVGDLQQTVVLSPNRPGASVAVIDVLDTRRPSPGPVTGVSVIVRAGDAPAGAPNAATNAATGVAATRVTPNRWAAGVDLPAAGAVNLQIVLHRRGLLDVRSTVRWVVAPTSSEPAAVLSRQPLAGPLAWSAAAIAAAALLGCAVLLTRRRRSRAARARGSTHPGAGRPMLEFGELDV